MPRLKNPAKGTIINVGEASAARYLALGWIDPNLVLENPEGENPEGENPEGENPDSEDETPEGETPEDETPEGETPDSEDETPEGEKPAPKRNTRSRTKS